MGAGIALKVGVAWLLSSNPSPLKPSNLFATLLFLFATVKRLEVGARSYT